MLTTDKKFSKNKALLPLNLQFFAEAAEETEEQQESEEPTKVELTEEELLKKIEAESDRKLAKALEKQKKEWEAEKERIRKSAEKEAVELAKLSEKEREQVEAEKRELAFKQREEELAAKEREFQRKKLELDTVDVLRERKLPIEFASFVLGEDSESTLENIVKFQEQWQEAIETEVSKRLATGKPNVGSKQTGTYNPWKKETYNLTEQGKIIRENPELAQKLKAQAGVR